MKRKLGWFLVALFIIAGLGYLGYTKLLLPRYVAKIIMDEETTPKYLPNRYEKRLVKSRRRINSGVDSVLVIIHRKNISLDQLLKAIDEVKEEQAYSFLDELNSTTIVSSDQVFDIGKKHFKTDFDIELFRDVFQKKAQVQVIKRGLILANKQRENQDMSPETIRAVAKQILIEKEKKFTGLNLSKDESTD